MTNLGRVLPITLAMFLSADVAARFFPLDSLCFQAWECMTRFQEPGSIFEAHRQFHSSRTHGNLSNMGNLPALREYRPQVFTTDVYGFRNSPALSERPPDGIVVGDSFVAGYGISDDETFPVRLSAATGLRMYNAGGPYAYLQTVRALKARLGMHQGPVVVVWTEAEPVDQLSHAAAIAEEGDVETRLLNAVLAERGDRLRSWLRGWWYTSPARIVAEKAFLALANDRILPNVYASRVAERRVQSGKAMLFYPSDVDGFHRHRDIGEARDYLMSTSTALSREGMEPLVLLAPSKYTVYYPILTEPKPAPGDPVHPLTVLEADLRAHGIPALDLTPSFQEAARRGLADGHDIYWRDDTHWNGLGTALAADLARRAWFPETVRH